MIMKKLAFTIFAAIVIGSFTISANAQMMGNFSNTAVDWNEVVEHTAREEQEGKDLWDKLQEKEVACENLNDEQFGASLAEEAYKKVQEYTWDKRAEKILAFLGA